MTTVTMATERTTRRELVKEVAVCHDRRGTDDLSGVRIGDYVILSDETRGDELYHMRGGYGNRPNGHLHFVAALAQGVAQ